MNIKTKLLSLFLALCIMVSGCTGLPTEAALHGEATSQSSAEVSGSENNSGNEQKLGPIGRYVTNLIDKYLSNSAEPVSEALESSENDKTADGQYERNSILTASTEEPADSERDSVVNLNLSAGAASETDGSDPSPSSIPVFDGSRKYFEIDNNIPHFEETVTAGFIQLGDLDALGRCTTAYACIGPETLPDSDEERGDISSVTPAGWDQEQYEIHGTTLELYNRSHLIGWQMSGLNAEERNLTTLSEFGNQDCMTEFENPLTDYVLSTGNHVMYRVTPVYDGDDLLPTYIHMEAYSVEDNGAGCSFNVGIWNEEPGVYIDHATGESHLDDSVGSAYWAILDAEEADNVSDDDPARTYVVNERSDTFHDPDCEYAENIADNNKRNTTKTYEEMVSDGYEPCGACLDQEAIKWETYNY